MKDETLKKMRDIHYEMYELLDKLVRLKDKKEAGESIDSDELDSLLGQYVIKTIKMSNIANE